MKIQITPVQYFPHTATQIEFLPAEVTLGVGARSQYILQTAEGQNLTSAWVAMTPEQCAGWTDNDDYAVACFLSNLNITPLTPLDVQLGDLVAARKGAIAAFEAEKATHEAAKAASEAAKAAAEAAKQAAEVAKAAAQAAEAAAKSAADSCEAECKRCKAAEAELAAMKQAAEDAAKAKAEFDAAVAAAVAAQTKFIAEVGPIPTVEVAA